MGTKQRSLEMREDLLFAHRQWRIQRIGWVVMALVLLAALLGVFGRGPLSHAREVDGSLDVEYERFARANAPTQLRLRVDAASDGVLRVAIDRRYLDAVPIDHVRPRPLREESSDSEVIYDFASPPGGPLHVSFDMTPRDPGIARGAMRLMTGSPAQTVRFHQLIYP